MDYRQGTGRLGEREAVRFLMENGYAILKRNYRTRFGEIDIVARSGETIVFVEVKSRRTRRYGDAKYSITPQKRRKLTLAGLGYLKEHGLSGRKARFDVVSVFIRDGGPPTFELIRNAFEPAAD